MSIRPDEISSIIKKELENIDLPSETEKTGYVIRSGDGIARIYGIDNCMFGELLDFGDGIFGMALNLEEDNIGCVILGDDTKIKEGLMVKSTGKQVQVPVGPAIIGRVVDPLGFPIDGKGPIETDRTRPIEFMAPGVTDRKAVTTPLQTGIMAIDSMIPIGRGLRELIIGDRQTGKTAICVDTILNQKGKDVICIYVAIGQKASTVAGVAAVFEKFGAMEYTAIVSSTASDTAAVQYIAPYAGCAMAEEFMYTDHRDVLIVYDDLSKHAVAYRAMSLLLKRPPGREAYPGDVFYLHSRLLERAASLSAEYGGGSITALPIIETMAGDITSYIPTNVISITDGQIYLESELFFAGQRPAINVGLSVSRVGSKAQTKAMKKVAGSLRIDLAQYRELAIFTQFGSELDQITRDKLSQGERLVEVLKQPQYTPMTLEDQIVVLFCAVNHYLLDIAVKDIRRFNDGLIKHIKITHPDIGDSITEKKELTDETSAKLKAGIEEYKKEFIEGKTEPAVLER